MNPRHLAVSLLLLATAASVSGSSFFDRGHVLMESQANLWTWQHGWQYAAATGFYLIWAPVPFATPEGRFFVSAPNQIVFHHRRTMYVWDGVPRFFTSGETGYVPIFHDDAPLTEIVPMQSGNFLVGGQRLIEFNTRGRVATYVLPESADHFELLADQCTVLYAAGRVVRRFNLCTNQQGLDFAHLPFEANAGSIRALPNGEVLVAAKGIGVLRYTAAGFFAAMYDAPDVTHIALNPDGTGFWAGGASGTAATLRRFDLISIIAAQDVPLGNPEMQSVPVPEQVNDLVVAGEWRASARQPRTRAVRR